MKEFKLNNRTSVKGLIHQKTIDYLETEEEKNYIEYRDKFDKVSNFKKIYDYPIHIDLEIDNICNFACSFVQLDNLIQSLKNGIKLKKKYLKKKYSKLSMNAKKLE